jgi:hypothetical protein
MIRLLEDIETRSQVEFPVHCNAHEMVDLNTMAGPVKMHTDLAWSTVLPPSADQA